MPLPFAATALASAAGSSGIGSSLIPLASNLGGAALGGGAPGVAATPDNLETTNEAQFGGARKTGLDLEDLTLPVLAVGIVIIGYALLRRK